MKIRQDFFGFIDVLAVGPMGTIAVQTTTKANFAARWNKIIGKGPFKDKKEEDRALRIRGHLLQCLAAGWEIEVHGWAGVNDVRIQQVTMESLESILSTEEQDEIPF